MVKAHGGNKRSLFTQENKNEQSVQTSTRLCVEYETIEPAETSVLTIT